MNNRLLLIVAVLIVALLLTACVDESSTVQERQQTEEAMAQLIVNQPVPQFDWSLQRDVLIQIYTLTNEARNTWSVWTSFTGEVIGYCLTNPWKPSYYNGGGVAVAQAEPNGLYTGGNTDATWVLCVRVNGDIVPTYIEQKVITYAYEIGVDADGNIVDLGGPSAAVVEIGR